MYSLLVLGQIPGTNIQISFKAWLVMLVVMLVAICFGRPLIMPKLKAWVAQTTQQVRVPVHASQLHQRFTRER